MICLNSTKGSGFLARKKRFSQMPSQADAFENVEVVKDIEKIATAKDLEHPHTHTETKRIIDRLSRVVGHIESIKRMVTNDRDCVEILTQLAAVDAAIVSCARVVMKDHIDHCIYHAVQDGDEQSLENLHMAIDQFKK